MSVRPPTPATDPTALRAAGPTGSPVDRRRAALWFAALALLSAAVVAATAFTWRNAETFARERLLRSAGLYAFALEKGVRHAGPGALGRLDEIVADALGPEVLGVAFVDEGGAVRAAAGELPEGDLPTAPWVVLATQGRRLGTFEDGDRFAAAVPSWIGCRPHRRGWRRWKRWRDTDHGAPPPAPRAPGPPGPPPGPGPERPGFPGPQLSPEGPALAVGPRPEQCRGPRLAVIVHLDASEARQAIHQAHIQAAFVLAVLVLAWLLAWRWRRARRRAARLTAEAQRREKLAALGEMAAVLAHEIRNPLGAIRGHAQLAAQKLADDPRGARSLETVVAETTRLSALVDALLRYARPRPPEPRGTDLGALADRAVALLADEAAAAGVETAVVRPEGAVRCACDPDQVEQVLLNLLRNAVQAQPDGGRVRVTVARGRAAAVVRVEDAGPGIPAAERDGVFAPFVTTRAEGTGLGLAIARQIAEAHGGTLTAEESALGGAALALTLPDVAGDDPRGGGGG